MTKAAFSAFGNNEEAEAQAAEEGATVRYEGQDDNSLANDCECGHPERIHAWGIDPFMCEVVRLSFDPEGSNGISRVKEFMAGKDGGEVYPLGEFHGLQHVIVTLGKDEDAPDLDGMAVSFSYAGIEGLIPGLAVVVALDKDGNPIEPKMTYGEVSENVGYDSRAVRISAMMKLATAKTPDEMKQALAALKVVSDAENDPETTAVLVNRKTGQMKRTTLADAKAVVEAAAATKH